MHVCMHARGACSSMPCTCLLEEGGGGEDELQEGLDELELVVVPAALEAVARHAVVLGQRAVVLLDERRLVRAARLGVHAAADDGRHVAHGRAELQQPEVDERAAALVLRRPREEAREGERGWEKAGEGERRRAKVGDGGGRREIAGGGARTCSPKKMFSRWASPWTTVYGWR